MTGCCWYEGRSRLADAPAKCLSLHLLSLLSFECLLLVLTTDFVHCFWPDIQFQPTASATAAGTCITTETETGEIRVGPGFQARLPDLAPDETRRSETLEELKWAPGPVDEAVVVGKLPPPAADSREYLCM